MSETIREFLVKIGYQESGRAQFLGGLKSVTAEAAELAVAIKSAALAVQGAVAVIASNLEQLYFLSQRSGATAESIQAIGYAASRVGSSVEAARGSLEQLGRFLWSNPASETFIGSLGVQTRTANGQLRDTGQIMTDLVRRIRQEQPALQMAYARIFGIDENILRSPAGEMDAKQARYERMQRAAHYNVSQAAKDSHYFMDELGALGGAIGILQQKVASAFSRTMGEDIARFTTWLVNNFDKISAGIEWFAKKVIEASVILTDFGRGLWSLALQAADAWGKMDADQKKFIETMVAVGAAVLVLDGIMKMSLVGRLALIALALGGLILEYQAWTNGAKSIIPWENWETEIQLGIGGIDKISSAFGRLLKVVRDDVGPALGKVFNVPDDAHGGWHAFLQDQIQQTIRDLTGFIDDTAHLIEIGAAIATGDFGHAWELYRLGKRNLGSGPGPNDVGGTDTNTAAAAAPPSMFRRFMNWGEQTDARISRWWRGASGGGGGGGGNVANANPQQRERMQKAYDLLTRKYNYPPESAAALVGNFFEESGMRLEAEGDPSIPGGSGGIGQWNRERRENFKRLFHHDVTEGSLEEQIAFVNWELNNTHKGVGDKLRAGGEVRSLSDVVLGGFEVPSEANQRARAGGGTAAVLLPQLRGGNARPISEPRPDRFYGDIDAPTAPPLGVGPQSMSTSNDNSRQVAMNQTITINVSAGRDGYEIGRAVQEAQRTMSQQTLRDMQARVT